MRYTNGNSRVLRWLVLILLATNAATIFSVIYHSQKEVPVAVAPSSEASSPDFSSSEALPQHQRTRFFRDQLDLGPNQINVFREVNRHYNRHGFALTSEMESWRRAMVEELGQPNPDSLRLDSIAHKIGELHYQLKKETIDFYLGMKTVCRPDQERRLYEIFLKMVGGEKKEASQHPGRGRGRCCNN